MISMPVMSTNDLTKKIYGFTSEIDLLSYHDTKECRVLMPKLNPQLDSHLNRKKSINLRRLKDLVSRTLAQNNALMKKGTDNGPTQAHQCNKMMNPTAQTPTNLEEKTNLCESNLGNNFAKYNKLLTTLKSKAMDSCGSNINEVDGIESTENVSKMDDKSHRDNDILSQVINEVFFDWDESDVEDDGRSWFLGSEEDDSKGYNINGNAHNEIVAVLSSLIDKVCSDSVLDNYDNESVTSGDISLKLSSDNSDSEDDGTIVKPDLSAVRELNVHVASPFNLQEKKDLLDWLNTDKSPTHSPTNELPEVKDFPSVAQNIHANVSTNNDANLSNQSQQDISHLVSQESNTELIPDEKLPYKAAGGFRYPDYETLSTDSLSGKSSNEQESDDDVISNVVYAIVNKCDVQDVTNDEIPVLRLTKNDSKTEKFKKVLPLRLRLKQKQESNEYKSANKITKKFTRLRINSEESESKNCKNEKTIYQQEDHNVFNLKINSEKDNSPKSSNIIIFTKIDENHIIKAIDCCAEDKLNHELQSVTNNNKNVTQTADCNIDKDIDKADNKYQNLTSNTLEAMADELSRNFHFDNEETRAFKESARELLGDKQTQKGKRKKISQLKRKSKRHHGHNEKVKKTEYIENEDLNSSTNEETESINEPKCIPKLVLNSRQSSPTITQIKNAEIENQSTATTSTEKSFENSLPFDNVAEIDDDNPSDHDRSDDGQAKNESGDNDYHIDDDFDDDDFDDDDDDDDYEFDDDDNDKSWTRPNLEPRNSKRVADLEGMLTRMKTLRKRGGEDVVDLKFDDPIPLEYKRRRRRRQLIIEKQNKQNRDSVPDTKSTNDRSTRNQSEEREILTEVISKENDESLIEDSMTNLPKDNCIKNSKNDKLVEKLDDGPLDLSNKKIPFMNSDPIEEVQKDGFENDVSLEDNSLPKITSVISLAESAKDDITQESYNNFQKKNITDLKKIQKVYTPNHTNNLQTSNSVKDGVKVDVPTPMSMPLPFSIYNSVQFQNEYQKLRRELATLDMVALQKEKERNNILRLKKYKQTVMHQLQLKRGLLIGTPSTTLNSTINKSQISTVPDMPNPRNEIKDNTNANTVVTQSNNNLPVTAIAKLPSATEVTSSVYSPSNSIVIKPIVTKAIRPSVPSIVRPNWPPPSNTLPNFLTVNPLVTKANNYRVQESWINNGQGVVPQYSQQAPLTVNSIRANTTPLNLNYELNHGTKNWERNGKQVLSEELIQTYKQLIIQSPTNRCIDPIGRTQRTNELPHLLPSANSPNAAQGTLPSNSNASQTLPSSEKLPDCYRNSALARLLTHPANINNSIKPQISVNSTAANNIVANGKRRHILQMDRKLIGRQWPTCHSCHSNMAKYICAGCNKQWYCSEACQVVDWKTHFKTCHL